MPVLMVIHDPDLGCVAIGPPEDHSPLVVDPDRIETFQVASQFLQMVRGRHREIAYPARCVDRFELALGTTGDPLKLANNLIFEQRLCPLVAKGSNHRRIIPHTGTRSKTQTHDLPRYSMTSSARPRSDSGIVRPSAFAVLRLTISSNFIGCWTGKSAGLAPFRILST